MDGENCFQFYNRVDFHTQPSKTNMEDKRFKTNLVAVTLENADEA
jgi:hypothetical protein